MLALWVMICIMPLHAFSSYEMQTFTFSPYIKCKNDALRLIWHAMFLRTCLTCKISPLFWHQQRNSNNCIIVCLHFLCRNAIYMLALWVKICIMPLYAFPPMRCRTFTFSPYIGYKKWYEHDTSSPPLQKMIWNLRLI